MPSYEIYLRFFLIRFRPDRSYPQLNIDKQRERERERDYQNWQNASSSLNHRVTDLFNLTTTNKKLN